MRRVMSVQKAAGEPATSPLPRTSSQCFCISAVTTARQHNGSSVQCYTSQCSLYPCTLGWDWGEAGNTRSPLSASSDSHSLLKTTGVTLKSPKLLVIPPFDRYVTPPTPRLSPDLLSHHLQQTCEVISPGNPGVNFL